jgi:pimeloyl-ACP methyl ester carboxylesterase
MKRFGYTKFVAAGGDWGAIVTEWMGVQAPPELIGIHTNMPGILTPDIAKGIVTGAPAPPDLSEEEKLTYDTLKVFFAKWVAYGLEMGFRPQTLYAIEDSPVGLAAWLMNHDPASLELIQRSIDGVPEGLTPDDVLDNITRFWLTKTGVTSSRLYWELLQRGQGLFDVRNVSIPVAVSVFPDEAYRTPRSWAEQAFPKLIYYNKVPKGGHFAAWEQPQLYTEEVRAGFRSLRQ